jgi:hypothetical protein
MSKTVSAIAPCLLGFCSQANASTVLYSSVTADPGNLYTYNYVVNNTAGTDPIFDFAVLVTPLAYNPPFIAFSAPSGWTFSNNSHSGSIADPPYNENGSFFEFYTPSSYIAPGSVGDFSFTTYLAPAFILVNGVPENNYFVDGVNNGIDAFGVALAPDFATTVRDRTWFDRCNCVVEET